jgi:hypothetical protein
MTFKGLSGTTKALEMAKEAAEMLPKPVPSSEDTDLISVRIRPILPVGRRLTTVKFPTNLVVRPVIANLTASL